MNYKNWLLASFAVILPSIMTAEAIAENAENKAMLDQSQEAVAQRRYEQARPRKEAPIDPKVLDGYIGYYQLVPGNIFSITRDGSHLFVQTTGGQPNEILPESDRDFFFARGAAQISFVTDEQGKASELVLHAGGFDRTATRIEETEAKAYAETLERRIKDSVPAPGSEAALRRHIEALRRGQPLYDEMGPGVAWNTRERLAFTEKDLKSLGELHSVTFKGVGRGGSDVYDVRFAGGDTEWRIFLAPDGKTRNLSYRFLP